MSLLSHVSPLEAIERGLKDHLAIERIPVCGETSDRLLPKASTELKGAGDHAVAKLWSSCKMQTCGCLDQLSFGTWKELSVNLGFSWERMCSFQSLL